MISRIGIGGGTGCVFEYCGSAIRALSMEERMTVCNMSIEAGARAGLVAPDDTTYQYLNGRPFAPKGAEWDAAVARWKQLPTDEGAAYDNEIIDRRLDAGADDHVRHQSRHGHRDHRARFPIRPRITDPLERDSLVKALRYMDLQPGEPLLGHPVERRVHRKLHQFAHLRSAHRRRRAEGPQSESERARDGGSRLAAGQSARRKPKGSTRSSGTPGAEWREAGCSMCIAMNGDQLQPGEYSVSTSNRNFEGRQGKGGRTFLASPLTAAASAITGVVTDVRTML